MVYTMEDFKRDYVKEHFLELTPEEQGEVLRKLPPDAMRSLSIEVRLAGLIAEQLRQYLEQMTAKPSTPPRKPRRKR